MSRHPFHRAHTHRQANRRLSILLLLGLLLAALNPTGSTSASHVLDLIPTLLARLLPLQIAQAADADPPTRLALTPSPNPHLPSLVGLRTGYV